METHQFEETDWMFEEIIASYLLTNFGISENTEHRDLMLRNKHNSNFCGCPPRKKVVESRARQMNGNVNRSHKTSVSNYKREFFSSWSKFWMLKTSIQSYQFSTTNYHNWPHSVVISRYPPFHLSTQQTIPILIWSHIAWFQLPSVAAIIQLTDSPEKLSHLGPHQ